MVPTLVDLRFPKVRDGIMYFILQSSKHSEGETSLKKCMRTRKRFGKLKRLSNQEESKELYNIECSGQAAQS